MSARRPAGQGCHGHTPFRHWKDHSEDDDDNDGTDSDEGATGQPGHAYEVTIRYMLV